MPQLAAPILTAAHGAFTSAMTNGLTLAGAVAVISALGLATLLPRRPGSAVETASTSHTPVVPTLA
jgi:hypothetical protein